MSGAARPSARFTAWLEKQLVERHPGTRLPTTAQCAATWGVSPITVSRILRTYRLAGRIVRIPRRGTFIAPLDQALPQPAEPASSLENIIEWVRRSIASGALRKGDALPSVKYMSRQFHVAPRTVIAAYRRLQSQTHVVRVGKGYWVGTFAGLTKYRRGAEVLVLEPASTRRGTDFSEAMMGLGLRAMEKELVDHGLVVTYETLSSAPDLLERWNREGRWPAGLVFSRLYAGDTRALEPLLAGAARPRRPLRPVPMLAVIDTADYHALPPGTHMVSHGNVHTMMARTLVQYMGAAGLAKAYFFVEYDGHNLFDVFVPMKVRTEVRAFDPGFTTRFYVTAKRAGLTRERFLHLFRERTVPGYRKDAILAKYRPTTAEEVEGEIVMVGTGQMPFAGTPPGLWVFNSDACAAEALAWARSARVNVPQDLSIISFEDNPAYHHHSISACTLDWNHAGYLMAHALLGDITYEKTSRGFMRLGAVILHRRTTKPG